MKDTEELCTKDVEWFCLSNVLNNCENLFLISITVLPGERNTIFSKMLTFIKMCLVVLFS